MGQPKFHPKMSPKLGPKLKMKHLHHANCPKMPSKLGPKQGKHQLNCPKMPSKLGPKLKIKHPKSRIVLFKLSIMGPKNSCEKF